MHNYSLRGSAEQFSELLEQAIESNDLIKMDELLLKNSELINNLVNDLTTYPPLWAAALKGRYEIVELFIKYGASVQEMRLDEDQVFGDSHRLTVLHWMGIKAAPCNDDHIKVGEVLIRHGADIDASNSKEKIVATPLEYAVATGNLKWAEFLLQKGASLKGRVKISIVDILSSRSPKSSFVDSLALLLKYGLCARSRNWRRETLLLILSERVKGNGQDSVKIAELLLDAGVPLDEGNICSWTPLRQSIANANTELARFLVERGADMNKKDVNSNNPLYTAVQESDKDFIDFLVSNGADLDTRISGNRTVLFAATARNDEEIVNLLLEKGANVITQDSCGQTPFYVLWRDLELDGGYDECLKRVLREFAKLKFEGSTMLELDVKLIQKNIEYRKYFENCFVEINEMSGTKFYGNYSYYSILKMSKNHMKKLVNLSKNEEFVSMFNANLDKMAYGKDLKRILDSAMKLRDRSYALESRLKFIFCNCLPAIAIGILENYLTLEDLPLQ